MLGFPSRSTYHHWAKLAREDQPFTLDVDALLRISAVFGIHQALGVLFADAGRGRALAQGAPHGPGVRRPAAAGAGHLGHAGWPHGSAALPRCGARGGLYMPPNALDAAFTPYEDADIVIT